jgi:hypothetical protein
MSIKQVHAVRRSRRMGKKGDEEKRKTPKGARLPIKYFEVRGITKNMPQTGTSDPRRRCNSAR